MPRVNTEEKPPAEKAALEEALARTELAEAEYALEKTGGKKTEAWKLLGLNDRYALRRRILRIMGSYPELAYQFPRVRKAYERALPGASSSMTQSHAQCTLAPPGCIARRAVAEEGRSIAEREPANEDDSPEGKQAGR